MLRLLFLYIPAGWTKSGIKPLQFIDLHIFAKIIMAHLQSPGATQKVRPGRAKRKK